ncbi:PMS1 protein homolog 1-like isoform X2 [Cimex lectularius]|uniref:HMG box domain-containing protein n=1 Tax=Cimex lectularius TaxID=79782 RepID=A0A8I6S1U5_CIMLE|nr:PMS1 protein homolog 1-like isoform X2 [Cimex lectularius]
MSSESTNGPSMNRLSSSTLKLISSAQVITSVSTVVKELIENSIDAGATNIEVKLENHGLARLEVKDNGCGIKKQDVPFMCKRSYTSKISDFSDLEKLNSYGFRGEALSSLCAVAEVSITTMTDKDDIAHTYTFDNNGDIVSSCISHLNRGTSVVAVELFKALPVRKQFLNSGKRRSEELKKVEILVKNLALINQGVRFVLSHNKFTIWQKSGVSSLMQSFVQVLPPTIVKQLHEIDHEEGNIKLKLVVPNRECNVSSTCYGNPMDAIFLFINSRPIRDKQIEKAIHEEVYQFFGPLIPVNKYPTCLITISLPPDSLDVNLEPNKTKVLIKDLDILIKLIKRLLIEYYVGNMEPPKPTQEVKVTKRKKDDGFVEVSSKIPKIDSEFDLPVLSQETESEVLNDECNKSSPMENNSSSHLASQDESVKTSLNPTSPQRNNKNYPSSSEYIEINSDSAEKGEFTTRPVESSLFKMTDSTNPSLSETEKHINDLVLSIFKQEDASDETYCEPMVEGEMMNDLSSLVDETQNNSSTENSSVDKPLSTLSAHCVLTSSDWSRGNVEFNGQSVQGTTVIAQQNESMLNYTGLETSCTSQLSERSVSSQMGQKDMAAFTKFAREMRAQIIKQSPGISFTSVASELSSRWKNLHENEKQVYKEQSKAEKECLKLKKQSNKASPIMKKKEERSVKKVYPKVTLWKISTDKIKEFISSRDKTVHSEQFEVLGRLNDNLIVVQEDESISVFSSQRLNEAMKLHNNISHMSVPIKVLENNIPILKEDIGKELWDTLLSLETTFDESVGKTVICSEKITKNGLRIEKFEDGTKTSFFITDVPLNISFFGIDDLLEILEEIKDRKGLCKMLNCRPMKVLSYIRSETLRSLSNHSPKINDSYVKDVYKFWKAKVRPSSCNCPHFHPISL